MKRDTASDDINRLFQAPLDRFVSERNRLASTLLAAGNRDEAARVKALAKPSASAWVANQLYWTARRDFDALIRAGDALRTAERAALAGTRRNVQEASEARRKALATLLKHATDAGWVSSPAMHRRVATTLDAVASYGSALTDPPPGRLTKDLDPPGFSALEALASAGGLKSTGREPAAIVKFPEPRRVVAASPTRKRAIERTSETLKKAKSDVAARRRSAERAEAAHRAAIRAVDRAREEVVKATRLLEEANDALKTAEDRARQLRAEAVTASAEAKQAEAAHEKGRTTLEAL